MLPHPPDAGAVYNLKFRPISGQLNSVVDLSSSIRILARSNARTETRPQIMIRWGNLILTIGKVVRGKDIVTSSPVSHKLPKG